MSDYGYYRKAKKNKVPRTRSALVLRILDILVLVSSVICGALLLCAYLSRYIDPDKAVFFAFPGLVFPVLYAIGGFLTLYWIIRWKRYAIVMAAILLLGIGNVRLFYRLDIRQSYSDNKPRKGELVIMSYNVMGLNPSYGAGGKSVQELVAQLVLDNHVDILCMQEFPSSAEYCREFNAILSDFRYRHIVRYHEKRQGDIGLAIYSRYPLGNKGFMEADPDHIRTSWADVRIRQDTIRVINNHLQSTTISGSDVDFLKGGFDIIDAEGEDRVKNMLRRMADNYKKRAPQAEKISDFAALSPHPVLVCGDLNDTPVSYVHRTISRGLQDSFVKKGRGVTGTYNGFFNMFRIDYIFMSPGIEVKNYYSFEEVYSDHNPVAASFEFLVKKPSR